MNDIYGLTINDMLDADELASIRRWNARLARERAMMDNDDVAYEAWLVYFNRTWEGLPGWPW